MVDNNATNYSEYTEDDSIYGINRNNYLWFVPVSQQDKNDGVELTGDEYTEWFVDE